MYRTLVGCLGICVLLVGLVLFPLPIPFGFMLIVIGVALLIYASDAVADTLRGYRSRHPRLNQRILHLGQRMPASIRRLFERTEPVS